MLLAGAVIALLMATSVIFVWVLRSSQAGLVHAANKHLEAVAHSMAEAYADRPNKEASLTKVDAPPPAPAGAAHPGPPPPPPAPPPPRGETDRDLSALTAKVLRDETGIEGGFYRPGDRHLVGYAFPTHEGPGDVDALPARETPNIVELAAAAVEQNKVMQDEYAGTHDVVLFTATPVCEVNPCRSGRVGAAWLMERIPGAETERKRTLLWTAAGFGGVACVTVILAFLVLTQVDRGTQAVLDRLTRMESDLSREDHPAAVNLAEFHRLFDGLDRLGDTLRAQMERERDLNSRLRQSERLAAIGQVAAGVAHELRNPLATIRLRGQMAQRKTSDASVAQAAGIILAEVDRLDQMIERLLNFSRPIRIHPALTDVSELCSGAVQRWSSRQPAIRFAFTGVDSLHKETDASRLEQVLDNVIENAVHQLIETRVAAPAIDVGCTRTDGRLVIEVGDNGGGFSDEALRNATEPFFTTRSNGTGLGLAITSEIVAALDGRLTLRNRGGGAVVSIQLPGDEDPA